ncbi:MAG: hypothetical protein GY847_13465 [Proteobacteria bacterium]|nr:hypothetical protein [Pseudomonadota bacterium]
MFTSKVKRQCVHTIGSVGLQLMGLLVIVSIVPGCDLNVDDIIDDIVDGDVDHDDSDDSGGDTDTQGDIDIDVDSDSDTDIDSDSDVDSDTDTDSDSDSDVDTDADTDFEEDAGSDSDGDADTDLDAGSNSGSELDCLIISEYIEGTGRNKGFELYNCGEESIDLSPYSVCLVSNDNTDCGTTLDFSEIAEDSPLEPLAAGGVVTICYSKIDLIDKCDFYSGVGYFNGDDRLALMRNDQTVDAFGRLNNRPNDMIWADVTLRRYNFTPFLGDGAFDFKDYYTAHDLDDFSDFGVPPSGLNPDSGIDTDTDNIDTDPDTDVDMDAGTNSDAGQNSDTDSDTGDSSCLIISEYVEGSGWNKGFEVYNCGEEDLDLSSYAVCSVSNANTTCSTTLGLEGTLVSGGVATICHSNADVIAECTFYSGVAGFNGDDRLSLIQSGQTVDAFGQLAVRPEGTPWSDMTLRRCNFESLSGDEPFELADYYTTHDKDDFSNFGIAPSDQGCTAE